MYDSQQPFIFPVATLRSIPSRCHAHHLASAFLSSPRDCGQRSVDLAAPHAASVASIAAPVQHSRGRHGGSPGHSSFLEWVPPRPRFVQRIFGRTVFLDLELAGDSDKHVSDKPGSEEHVSDKHDSVKHGSVTHDSDKHESADTSDLHHLVHHLHFNNPLVIGVASMIIGTGIGAGIVIALSAGQRVEGDMEEWPIGEARGSQPFVPFTGSGNRMGEDVASPALPELAVASEASGGDFRRVQDAAWDEEVARRRASEESQKKAQEESRSKAKAKQKAEEEARLKAHAEEDARLEGFEEGFSAASAASRQTYFMRGGTGKDLRTGNPKHDGTATKKKKKKKRRKKQEDDGLQRLVSDIAVGSAAVADAAGTAFASTVDAATDHLVDVMQAAEDELRTSESGGSSGEDDEEEDEEKEGGTVGEGDAPPEGGGAPAAEGADDVKAT